MTYRILVTGSRTWTDHLMIEDVLIGLLANLGSFTLVHGACPKGADAQADRWARQEPGVTIDRYPADWLGPCNRQCKSGHRRVGRGGKPYCPNAGFTRNKMMVQYGADLCLAFIKDGSSGATHCADLAEREGIETRRFTA